MANEDNLIRIKSASEAREIGRLGGRASAKARREKKAARELAQILLSVPVTRGKFKKSDEVKALMDLRGANMTVGMGIMAKITQKALGGDLRAARLMYELSGDMKQNVNLSGEIEVKRDLSRLDDKEVAMLAGLVAKTNADDERGTR